MKASRKKHRRFPARNGKPPTLDGPPQRFTIELEHAGDEGETVGYRDDGKAVLASYGISGERVVVEVREEYPSHIIAEVVEVVRASPQRVEPPCPHFGVCGGCQLQHISYEEQGRIKRGVVANQIRRIGRIVAPPVAPILAAENPWNYRNNARFTVRREGEVGFTHWHTHRFEPIDECLIMDPRVNDIKRRLEGALTSRERQLAVRIGRKTGDTLVHPALNISGVERGVETGQKDYQERLFHTDFRVSAASFFQVNTAQAERMIALVRDRLQLRPSDTIVDAYAGVGSFAALLAPLTGRVIAIEESAAAVRDAEVNLAPFSNTEIVHAKTEDALQELDEHVDAVILDPPRAGCCPQVVDSIRRLKPSRITYVSCDPSTLARDLRRIILAGYRLTDVTPIDMFPQTYHIESVSTLEHLQSDGFILASTSARRREILSTQAASFAVLAPDSRIEDPASPGEYLLQSQTSLSSTPVAPTEEAIAGHILRKSDPAALAESLALKKAQSVAEDAATVPVVGADTVVVAPDGQVLGKPRDAAHAREMLRMLKDGEHRVITAIAVVPPNGADPIIDHEVTAGRMRDYTDAEVEAYIATGDPFDKAGSYGIQHPEFRPVSTLHGCYLNVVGLPLCLLERLLKQAGAMPAHIKWGALPESRIWAGSARGFPLKPDESPVAFTPPDGSCHHCVQRTPPELRLP